MRRSRSHRGAREIWADFDRDTLVVYQAYGGAIADAAVAAGTFVPPFSLRRMTWIKPSFLWLMARSNWATRSGQTRILAVRITRAGWESALAEAVLTDPDPTVYGGDREAWSAAFEAAPVHAQWDPERSLRGGKLPHRSIQVGIGRHRIEAFVQDWVVGIEDLTPRVRSMRDAIRRGGSDKARRHLPREAPYPLPAGIAARLGMQAP